jgi:multiple sugar transport system permease protein
MPYLILYILLLAAVCLGAFLLLRRFERRKPAAYRRAKSAWEPYLYILPVFLLLLFMFGYPLINSFIMAFESYKLTAPNAIRFNGLANFQKLFMDRDIGLIMRNSLVYVVASVAGQFVLGMTLALALRKKFRGRGLYQAAVFLPWAFRRLSSASSTAGPSTANTAWSMI